MDKPRFKYEILSDKWVDIFMLINDTHYEWLTCVIDMEMAKKYTSNL